MSLDDDDDNEIDYEDCLMHLRPRPSVKKSGKIGTNVIANSFNYKRVFQHQILYLYLIIRIIGTNGIAKIYNDKQVFQHQKLH